MRIPLIGFVNIILLHLVLNGCISNNQDYYNLSKNSDPSFVEMELLENDIALCTDNLDNDYDGLIDCEDPDCTVFQLCDAENTAEECNDGKDNDNNGSIDCDDESCTDIYYCRVPTQETMLVIGFKENDISEINLLLNKTTSIELPMLDEQSDSTAGEVYAGWVHAPGKQTLKTVSDCFEGDMCGQAEFNKNEWGDMIFMAFTDTEGDAGDEGGARSENPRQYMDISDWFGTSLHFHIKTSNPIDDLSVKLEYTSVNEAYAIQIRDYGYDPSQRGWQEVIMPFMDIGTKANMIRMSIPFSIVSLNQQRATVTIDNVYLAREDHD